MAKTPYISSDLQQRRSSLQLMLRTAWDRVFCVLSRGSVISCVRFCGETTGKKMLQIN